SVRAGRLRRMVVPAVFGVRPRSEPRMAFSIGPTMLLSQGVITSERASDTETAATCESGTSLPYALTRMLSTRPVEARPVRTLTRLWRRASMLLAMRACASCLISLIIAVFPGVAESADYTGNAAPGPGSGTAPDGRHEKGRA